ELPLDCTWGALLAETRRVAGLSSDADVVLSLNKKAPLDGSLDKPLSSLGISGGDLLWLLSPQLSSSGQGPATANCLTARAEEHTSAATEGPMGRVIRSACADPPTAPAVSPAVASSVSAAQPPLTSATTRMDAQAQVAKTSGGAVEPGKRHGLTESPPGAVASNMSGDCGDTGRVSMEVEVQPNTSAEDEDRVKGDGDAAAMQGLPAIRGVSFKLLRLLVPSAASALAVDGAANVSTRTSLGGGGDGGSSGAASCAWMTLTPATRCLLVLDCAMEEAGFVGLQDLPARVSQGHLIPRQLLYGCSYVSAAVVQSDDAAGDACNGGNMESEAAAGLVPGSGSGGGLIGPRAAAMKLLWYVMGRYLVVHGAPCITNGAAAIGGISPVTWNFDLSEYGGCSGCVADIGTGSLISQSQQGLEHALPPDPAAHWRRLKDGLVLPLLAATCRAVGLTPPLGLMVLPMELQLAVLRRLEARDLAALSCACTALHHLASEDEIWRPLLEKEFDPVLPAADAALANSHGYKYLFGRKWLERAERRKRRQVFRQATPMWGIPRPAPFIRPPFMPPGSIGGDYDRLPASLLGFGHPALPRGFGGGGVGGTAGTFSGFPRGLGHRPGPL
ncbi:hypothetical protein VaNZ11_009546, partial [Volvox africanus]